MRITVPEAVEEIIGKLKSRGFEAFAVGGCVRDALLGREPGDWDITTSASPWQVKEIFPRTIDTGIQHGTVTIMQNHVGYEVTTYRIDGEYEDGRHPKSVAFTQELTEDLCRRDFTINAMAYSHETGIVDVFGGMEDLRNGIIRCVGNPIDRFTEDALRILRAVRFSAQLGFAIEEETRAAIRKIAPNLVNVSKERIQTELTKLLLSPHPEKIREVYAMGVSPYVSASFQRVNIQELCINPALPRQKHIRWAAMLKDEDAQTAVRVLKELKLDNDTIFRVSVLVQWIHREIPKEKTQIRRAMSQMEPELFDDLLVIKASLGDSSAKQLEELTAEIRQAGECTSLKDLALSGRDLLEHGMKPGKQVGAVLSELLAYVLEYPEQNQKEILLNRVFGR